MQLFKQVITFLKDGRLPHAVPWMHVPREEGCDWWAGWAVDLEGVGLLGVVRTGVQGPRD